MGATMMQVCEAIYGRERAAEVQAFLEGALGRPCPCKQGQVCPLMPQSRAAVDGTAPGTA